MARSLAERRRAHEQQKARLAEQEAKLKADGRKARTRQLIQAGGLIDKADLLELDPNALYGALLSLRDGAGDPEQVRHWAVLGGRTFACCGLPWPRRCSASARGCCRADYAGSGPSCSPRPRQPSMARPVLAKQRRGERSRMYRDLCNCSPSTV
jgi:hypothetical protein